jgi:hypothetical protein
MQTLTEIDLAAVGQRLPPVIWGLSSPLRKNIFVLA